MFELLTNHVLDHRYDAKKDRAVQRTLLHDFASQAMPECVEFLLRNGAHVNALQRQTLFIAANPRNKGKKVWYQTPWNAMKTSGEFWEKTILARNTHSLQQRQDLQARYDRCRKALEDQRGYT
jgi:hypothetical protein